MKRAIILIIPLFILLVTSCSSSRFNSANNELRNSIRKEEIKNAVESDRYIIKINRVMARRGPSIDLKPSNNYIIIDRDLARVNLAYVGRSHDTRGIMAINMTGKVIERKVRQRNNGGYEIKLKIKQNNDQFNVSISTGASGYSSVNINHLRLDSSRYLGNMTLIN